MIPNSKVIFLCGSLRSGTTVLGLMFRYHPDIHAPGERDFLFDFLNDDPETTDKKNFLRHIRKDRLFTSLDLIINDELSPIDIVRDLLSQMQKKNKYTVINAHRHFSKIPKIFPNASFIHLLRDPRDVARSAIGMGWAGNVFYGVDVWLESERSWDELVLSINRNRTIITTFENIIEHPQEELSRLCNFIGVNYSPSMLEYPKYSTYSLPDPSLTYQWIRKQTPDEIALVEFKVRKYFPDMRGYELANEHCININQFLIFKLWLHNKWYKNIFSIRRFGFYLFVIEKVTRWLNIHILHDHVIKQINNINKRYLK